MAEETELTAYARSIGVGRNHLFYILKCNGWVRPDKPSPTTYAERQGLLTSVSKLCKSPRFSHVKFTTTHITEQGKKTFEDSIPEMVANIRDEEIKRRISSHLVASGLLHP